MPELPQIQPRGGIAAGGAIETRPSRFSGQLAAQAQEIQNKALEMSQAIRTVNRTVNYHNADADYITGVAGIDTKNLSIIDPDARHAQNIKDYTNLLGSVLDRYPDAGPELRPQLNLRLAESIKNSRLAAVALSADNLKSNVEASHDRTIAAWAAAPTPTAAEGVKQSYMSMIDDNVASGLMHQGDGEKYKATMDYDLKVANYVKMGNDDPFKAMPIVMNAKDIMPKDKHEILYQIEGRKRQMNDRAQDDLNVQRNAALEATINGSASDGQVEQFWTRRLITQDVYHTRFGHDPTNVGATSLLRTQLENNTITDVNALDKLFNTAVLGRRDLESQDVRELEGIYHSERSILSSAEGVEKVKIANGVTSNIAAQHPEWFGTWAKMSKDAIRVRSDLGTIAYAIKHAPTLAEAQSIADAAQKKYPDKKSAKHPMPIITHTPLPPGLTSSPAASSSPTAAPTPDWMKKLGDGRVF